MKKPKSPELISPPRKQRKTAATALKISIFRRKGSRFWQALIRMGKTRKRITTRTTLKAAALEFAELAYRHFSRQHHEQKSR